MGIHKGRGSMSALLITVCLLSTGHGYYQGQSGPPQPRYIPASSGGGGAGGQPSYRYNPPPQESYNAIPAGGYNEPYRPPAKRGYPSSVPQQYYSPSSGAYSGGYQSNQPGYQTQSGYPPPPPGQPGYPPNPPPAQPSYQPSYPPGQQPYQAPVDYQASNGYPSNQPAPAAQAPPPAYPPSNQYPPPPAYDRGYGGPPGYQGGYNGQQPYNGYYEVAPNAFEVVPPRQPGAYTPQMVATTSTTTTTTTTAVPTTTVMAELEPQEFEGVTTLAPTTTTIPTTTPTTTLPPTPAPQYRPYPGQYGPGGPPGQYGNGPPPQGPQQPWDRQGSSFGQNLSPTSMNRQVGRQPDHLGSYLNKPPDRLVRDSMREERVLHLWQLNHWSQRSPLANSYSSRWTRTYPLYRGPPIQRENPDQVQHQAPTMPPPTQWQGFRFDAQQPIVASQPLNSAQPRDRASQSLNHASQHVANKPPTTTTTTAAPAGEFEAPDIEIEAQQRKKTTTTTRRPNVKSIRFMPHRSSTQERQQSPQQLQQFQAQRPVPYNPNPGFAQPGYPPAGSPAYGTPYQQQPYPNPYGYPQQPRAPPQAVGYRPAPQQQPAAAPYRPPPQSQAAPYRPSPPRQSAPAPTSYGPPGPAPASYGTPPQAPAPAGNYRSAAPAPPRAPAPAPTPIRSYGSPPAGSRPSYQVSYGPPQTYRQSASPNYSPTPAASLANSRPQYKPYNSALPPQSTQYRPRPTYTQSQSAQPYNPAPAPAPAPYNRPAPAQPYRQPPAQTQYGRAPATYGRAPAAPNPYRQPPPSGPSSNYRPQSNPPYQAATSNPYNRPPSQPRPYTRYNRSPTVPAPKPQPEKKTSIAELTQQLSKVQTPQPKAATPGPTHVIKTSPSLPRRPPGAPIPNKKPMGSQVTFISPQNLRFPTPVPFSQTPQPQRVEVGRIVQSSSQSQRNKFFRGRRSVKSFPMVEQTSIPHPIMEQPTIVQPLFGRPAIVRPMVDSPIMDSSSDVFSNHGHYIQDTLAEAYSKNDGSNNQGQLAPITPKTGITSKQHDLTQQVSMPRDAWLNQASRSLSDLLNETPRIQDLSLAESMPNQQQETRGQTTPLFNAYAETPVTVPQLKGFGAFYHSFVDDFRKFGKRGIHMSTVFPGA